jgi:predicted XRE-type DNA-binding protein
VRLNNWKSIEGMTNRQPGNIDLPLATELNTKLGLAKIINETVASRHLGQKQAAILLGISQPKVSALANYKVTGFSVQRLMELLTVLGIDVEIVIRRKAAPEVARIHITAA